jgi:hypothetical protein
MSAVDCCAGEASSCEVPRSGTCARCGNPLTIWARARGGLVYCGWYCHSHAAPAEPVSAEIETQRRRLER